MDRWPDDEEILARFRDWLEQARSECTSLDEEAGEEELAGEPVGLYQLVEQLTALRHDVKLLTKSARGAEERQEATLLSLQAAIEQFRAIPAKEEEAADKAARPLVEALVDLDEALIRGRGVIEQARQRVLEDLNAEIQQTHQRLDDLFRTQPWWRRLLCRPWHEATRALYTSRTLDTYRGIFDSLVEGYDLILNRLRRTMNERSIVRTRCLGEPADPNRMTVIEVVGDLSRRPGTVVEEIRPGYCWEGKVLRFAEVKAVAER
jgi:molecular chaperone GrpE